jgi:exoribonuclease-2
LRRYVDLVNQRQIINLLRDEAPVYARNDNGLFAILRDFDAAYTLYNDFQRQMERYWCLRWLLQEEVTQTEVLVLRENLVKLTTIPLVSRIPSLPELPPNTRAILEIGAVDLLDLNFDARFVAVIEATPA